MPSSFVPDNEAVPSGADWDPTYYRRRVERGADWDTTYAFRLAEAAAKDSARNQLIAAIRLEEKRLQEQALTTLGTDYLTRETQRAAFAGQARANVYAQRTVDGVKGATDEAIKL